MENEGEIECPLCMEQLDWDDLHFNSCPCGYKVCRFCFNRLYNLEDDIEAINKSSRGLCPACRREYSDSTVYFNSDFTMENVEQMKKHKKKRNKVNTQKQKQLEDKQKLKEILKTQEKNLSGLRVVQKNLVFVIGLPTSLTQEDIRREFVKFGKIHKLVVGNCSSNVNTAYVTYTRAEDAIKAILALNSQSNHINHRLKETKNGKNSVLTLKASLGTTKYCTHWLHNKLCPKLPDCMYLHELAESEASFTKEQMQKGKHTEYEKKLISLYSSKESENEEKDSEELQSQQQQQQQQSQGNINSETSGSSAWVKSNTDCQEINDETSMLNEKKINLNTFDEIISSSNDSLSTSYSTCSSGASVPSPNVVEEVECLLKQAGDYKCNETRDVNTLDDDLDFDPISVSTSGLQDLIKNSSEHSNTNNDLNNLLHRNVKIAPQNTDMQQEWRSSLKAIFPNVNITFASNYSNNKNENNREPITQRINTSTFLKQCNNQRLTGSSYANYLPFMLQQQHQQQQQQQHHHQQQPPIPCNEYSWLQQQQQQNLQRHPLQQFIGNQHAIQRLYTTVTDQTHLNVRRYATKAPVYAPPPPGFSNF